MTNSQDGEGSRFERRRSQSDNHLQRSGRGESSAATPGMVGGSHSRGGAEGTISRGGRRGVSRPRLQGKETSDGLI